MEKENNFKETVASLFQGMDSFVSGSYRGGRCHSCGRYHYSSVG